MPLDPFAVIGVFCVYLITNSGIDTILYNLLPFFHCVLTFYVTFDITKTNNYEKDNTRIRK